MDQKTHGSADEEDVARLTTEIADAERQERLRLAEALHDDALQRLFVIRQDLAEASQGSDDRRLRDVDDQLQELTASLRGLVTAMHEEALESAPLEDAVRRLADDAARRGRLDVRTRVDPNASGRHDAFLLDIVRELLANVVRHAGAATAQVDVDVPGASVRVSVQDDGVGIAPERLREAGRDGHVGHARLHRRVAALDGALEVTDAPGGGTVVRAVVPLVALRAQRELEGELRRERRWSAALVAAIQDGFVVFRDGRVVQVNDRFCAMTGHSRDEVLQVGAESEGGWPSEQREVLLAHVLRGRRRGLIEEEAVLLRRDGTSFPALVAGQGIRDEAGRHVGMLVTVKDITSLHEAEDRRRHETELATTLRSTLRLRGLVEAALDVRGAAGLDTLLTTIGRTINDELGWAVAINLHRRAWDDFEVMGTFGMPDDAAEALRGQTYSWSSWSVLQERFLRRGAYFIPQEAGDVLWSEIDGVFWTPPASLEPAADGPDAWLPGDALLVPVRHSDGQWLGLLSLDLPASGRRPTDSELDVLTSAAGVIGIALQRATEGIEAAGHRAALEQLLRVSSRIAGARELEPVVDRVVSAITDALGFERVLVDALDPTNGCLEVRASAGYAPDEVPREAVDPEDLGPLFDIGFRVEGCYLLSHDDAQGRLPAARSAFPPSRRNGRGPFAWDGHGLVVPLYGSEHELVGVLWVDDPSDHLLPSAQRLQALRAFANQAAAALVSAEAYERLRRAADGDPLTSLANRRALDRELLRAAALSERTAAAAELVLVELSGLEHLDGVDADTVARGVRRILGEESRASDRAFLLERGLFALLLAGAGGAQLAGVVERIRRQAGRLDERLIVHVGRATIGAPGARSPQAALDVARTSLLLDAAAPGG